MDSLCKIDELKDSIDKDQLMFEKRHYLEGMIRKGPFAAAELRTKLQDNEIDGLTKIWSPLQEINGKLCPNARIESFTVRK